MNTENKNHSPLLIIENFPTGDWLKIKREAGQEQYLRISEIESVYDWNLLGEAGIQMKSGECWKVKATADEVHSLFS